MMIILNPPNDKFFLIAYFSDYPDLEKHATLVSVEKYDSLNKIMSDNILSNHWSTELGNFIFFAKQIISEKHHLIAWFTFTESFNAIILKEGTGPPCLLNVTTSYNLSSLISLIK